MFKKVIDEIIAAVNKEDVLCIEIVEEIGQKLPWVQQGVKR